MISENVQIYPAKTRVDPNDKATKLVFSRDYLEYARLVAMHKTQSVIEKKNHKKYGKITSSFQLSNQDGFTNIIPLDEFDRAVFSVCTSEWDYGNRYTTPAIILRGLTGKVGRGDAEPSPDQRTAILQSIDKLMCTLYDPDVIEAYQKMNYDTSEIEKLVKAPILPCKRVQKTVNGQVADIIYFTDVPTLFSYTSTKSQIIRYPVELLDVPKQQNTPRIIAVKNYVLRRVLEIRNHKMTPTITLSDVFKKIRITDAHSEIKNRVRDYLVIFFEHLQSRGIINFFQLTKKFTKFHGISFTF